MANINFGILDTQSPAKIGNAFIRSPEQQNANMLQAMQMKHLIDQSDQAQYAISKARREDAGLAAFGEGLRALGPDPDPDAVAQLFIKHPDRAMQQAGIEMMQKSRAEKGYGALGPMGGAAVARPAAAPASPFTANMMANRAALPTFGDNQLAATVAAPEAPVATRENLIAQIETRLRAIGPFVGRIPQAKAESDRLDKQLENLRKAQNVGAGGTLITAGLPDFTAPAAPSEFEKLLKDSGLTPEQQNVYRTAKLNKDTAIAQPEFIDNLKALAATKNPTERKFLTDRLIYMTAHPPGTNVKVNAYMPASEEAQRDFMRSTRATYDTLKQSPSMFANIEASKKLIPAASVFMGTGGEGMKAAASFLNNRLGMNVNTEGVKTAEELRSRLFQGILANLKRLDSQPSERQQAALEQALGNLNTDPNALSNVLDSYADTVRTNIDTHNAEVKSAITRGVKFPYDPIIKVPPKATGPDGYVEVKPTADGRWLGKKADGTVEVIK